MEEVLLWIVKKLAGAAEPYAVTGSTTLFLHGMDVGIGDVDIQTTASGAYLVEQLLTEQSRPLIAVYFRESELIRSYYGKLQIKDVQVEIMGQVQHHLAAVGWKEAAEVEQFMDLIIYNGIAIPATSLEHELIAYQEIGRPGKAATIREFLARNTVR